MFVEWEGGYILQCKKYGKPDAESRSQSPIRCYTPACLIVHNNRSNVYSIRTQLGPFKGSGYAPKTRF
jgi:hypothetical protein